MQKLLVIKVGSTMPFSSFPSPIRGYTGHYQSVLRLPPDARLLASSAMDRHQAFVIEECVWGVQFHPEFDADITIEYIRRESQALQAQRQQPERLIQGCVDTRHGLDLLRRFGEIVEKRDTAQARAKSMVSFHHLECYGDDVFSRKTEFFK